MSSKFKARLSQAFKKGEADLPAATPAAPAKFGIGSVIDQRYRLDAELGRGGMGIVYRAHDLLNDCTVAIKVINLDEVNALTRQQFAREAAIMAQLKHPHIVNVHQTGTVDTGGCEPWPFIVMEFVHGISLDEFRGFTYSRIIDLGQQICDALAYAHNQGFIHRDLKPANVLLQKRGFHYVAKLADFGLARPRGAANLPSESNLAGTIYYLAPEVIAGQPADISSDLYALGAMLYEMITGRVPFSDFIDDEAILAQHLNEAVAPPSHSRANVPPALEAIVLRLLAKDPKERFASAQEVWNALEQISMARRADNVRGNLPPAVIEPCELELEIGQVRTMLEASQLVTLLDDDKKLAIAAGAQLAEHFPDGVWMTDLGLLRDPSMALQTIVSVLGVRVDPQRSLVVSLIDHLHEKKLLLLLIHCDGLSGACAQLAETILATCPQVYILVTSHQPLNIPAEVCITFAAHK